MKDVADALARLNELGRPDLAEPIHFLMGERDGLMKALNAAKTVIESKDKAYSLIQQRCDAMAAKAATVDSERECNEKLTAEVDALSARVAELERYRDQLALSLSATKAERDHAVRSAELLGDELHNSESARRDFEHAWLEGRAIMAICGYFSRMRGPDAWQFRKKGCPSMWKDCLMRDIPGIEAFNRNGSIGIAGFEGYEIRELYAGSAPVPAVVSQIRAETIHNETCVQPAVLKAPALSLEMAAAIDSADYVSPRLREALAMPACLTRSDWTEGHAVDVNSICNAYESGVGHRGRPTANVNPYREGTPEHEAYAIGAKGEAAQAESKVADDVDLWKFCRDALKRGAEIESQFSQQGYETFIAEIECAAKKEEKRLRAMLAAKAMEK